MRAISLWILLFLTILSAQDTLYFSIPNFKPFTYFEKKEIKGIGVERILMVFEKIKQPIKLTIVPNYGRAVEEVRQGRSDGFFLATQNKERDSIAHFSNPVFINQWCWFSLKGNSLDLSSKQFKQYAKVATPLNANTHKWLKKKGFKNIFPSKDVNFIVPLLIENKVDAVFIAEEVFLQQLRENKIDESTIHKQVESQNPFGIYLSKSIIEKKPLLLKNVNITIDNLFNKGLTE